MPEGSLKPVAEATPSARRTAMALCGDATAAELGSILAEFGAAGAAENLRAPEIGLVMARGRIGGDGRPFNLGEVTITRAAVRLPSGEVGFAYHLGRDRAKARLAATLDALLQRAGGEAAVLSALAPVAARREAERARAARRAAATRVNFFTLVRGED